VKILLVEDDLEAAQNIAITLDEEGHRTILAGNGRDGLAEAQSGDFDLLVVDRMLPDLDGLTLVANLRAGRCSS
jgi:two-component system OmpR family response regulator